MTKCFVAVFIDGVYEPYIDYDHGVISYHLVKLADDDHCKNLFPIALIENLLMDLNDKYGDKYRLVVKPISHEDRLRLEQSNSLQGAKP